MHIYTSSFFKFRNKANFYSFLGASAGTGAPRNTHKIGTQCGCEYGYKNYESFGSLLILNRYMLRFGQNKARGTAVRGRSRNFCMILNSEGLHLEKKI